METSEFDKIIQEKLSKKNSVHRSEMERAKPKVWAAVSTNKRNKATWIPWMAAAAILLCVLLLPAYYYRNLEKTYSSNLEQLKIEINHKIIQQKNQVSAIELNEKIQLCSEIDLLKNELNTLKKNQITRATIPTIQTKVINEIVYLRDTIYLKSKAPAKIKEQLAGETTTKQLDETKVNNNEVSELIYPDYKPSKTVIKQDQALLKIIINPFKN